MSSAGPGADDDDDWRTQSNRDSATSGNLSLWTTDVVSADELGALLRLLPTDPDDPDRRIVTASCWGTRFEGDCSFGRQRLRFRGATTFRGARFTGKTYFEEVVFDGPVDFVDVTFDGSASFLRSTFNGRASFYNATFVDQAVFDGATFKGSVGFGGTTVGGSASFKGASFESERQLGPLLVMHTLELDRATFDGHITVAISAIRVTAHGTVFLGGADLFVAWAEVSLESADFAKASLLAPVSATVSRRRGSFLQRSFPRRRAALAVVLHGTSWMCGLDRATQSALFEQSAPRLASLENAKVAELTVSHVDLRPCRFAGAHGLDRVRLEQVQFSQPPSGRVLTRWTRRQTIAEEHDWHRARGHLRWMDTPRETVSWDTGTPRIASPEPEEIAAIYRALRKAREDGKDEPGAADFYYGEMEMRRHGAASGPERAVIWLYWLVSGYGLRASRALVALAITIAFGAVLLGLTGFDAGKHPDDGTLLFAAESSISLLRPPDTENLTAVGHVVQIALRLAGPLFFGLALLSLRGRVKR